MITKDPPEVLTTQKKLFMSRLNECQRRQFLGTEAFALGRCGVGKVTKFFGVSKTTVYDSINEIKSGYSPEPGRIRRRSGGRKRLLDGHLEWLEALNLVIGPRTAGLPQDESVIWVSMNAPEIAGRMAEKGCKVSEYIVRQILERLGFRRRSFTKDLPMRDVKDRDAQFLNIADLSEKFAAIGVPVLSNRHQPRHLQVRMRQHQARMGRASQGAVSRSEHHSHPVRRRRLQVQSH